MVFLTAQLGALQGAKLSEGYPSFQTLRAVKPGGWCLLLAARASKVFMKLFRPVHDMIITIIIITIKVRKVRIITY